MYLLRLGRGERLPCLPQDKHYSIWHTYTNPRPGLYLTQAHKHITRAVTAIDSCFDVIRAHQHGIAIKPYPSKVSKERSTKWIELILQGIFHCIHELRTYSFTEVGEKEKQWSWKQEERTLPGTTPKRAFFDLLKGWVQATTGTVYLNDTLMRLYNSWILSKPDTGTVDNRQI